MGGNSLISYSHNIKFDIAGNMYSVGYFSGTVDFDPGPGVFNLTSAGGEDIYIAKFDTNKNFVWAKRFGDLTNDRGYGITFDGDDNIYTTGFFSGTVDFDGNSLVSAGSNDSFIARIDPSNGDIVWAYGFGAAGSETGRYSHFDVTNNALYTVGEFRGTVDVDPGVGVYNLTSNGVEDIYIISYDLDGNFNWAGSIGTTSLDRPSVIKTDSSGNLYITGSFSNTVDFDPGVGAENLISNGSTDIFVAKYDSTGNFAWAHSFGSASIDAGYAMEIDENNQIYVAGSFTGTVDFDPGLGTQNLVSNGFGDGFLLKLDSSGNFVSVRGVGGVGEEYISDVNIIDTSSVYITGSFSDAVDFELETGTVTKNTNGGSDIFVAKFPYVPEGSDFEWVGTMGGASSENLTRFEVVSNYIYITSGFSGTVDFDPSSIVNNKTSIGFTDAYISVITFGPFLAEITPVGVVVNSNPISYTFNADEGGTISYGGSCSSATTTATTGNNTVNFSQLAPGTYSNCTIIVTDSNGNASNTLAVSPFTIVVHSGGGGSGPSSIPTSIPAPTPTPTPTPNPTPEPTPNPETPITPITNTYTSPIDGSSKSCPGFTKYLRKGNRNNDREETRLWQAFLNKYQNEKLKVDGLYGNLTEGAIKRFQNTYKEYILTLWNLKSPTGYTYQSTRAYANKIVGCSEGLVTLDNGITINY